MLRIIRRAYVTADRAARDGADPEKLMALPVFADIGRMRYWPAEEAEALAAELEARIIEEVEAA